MSELEKKHSKIQWFFFVIFIPAVFAVILFVIVMSVLGFDMIEKGKQVGASLPYVNQYFVDEEEEEEINVEELLVQISSHERTIEQLERQLGQKDEEIDRLLTQAVELGEELEQREEIVMEIKSDLQEIAKTYESMSAKNAANILAELGIEEAILHMSTMKPDSRANILAKMDAEKAAQIMSSLANQ